VGSALLQYSMAVQPDRFDLWVFQRNTRALEFYARHGCREVRRTDGTDNQERETDVLLHWAPAR
jgi:hypothetical protein